MRKQGFLLFDGCSIKHPMRWVYQNFPSHEPRAVLQGTDYAALSHKGPILLPVKRGDTVDQAWHTTEGPLARAVWLETELRAEQVIDFVQQRILVKTPDGRALWLRHGDSRSLLRAVYAKAAWPDGFWMGVQQVWLRDGELTVPALGDHEENETPVVKLDAMTPGFTLDYPLLHCLSGEHKERVA